MCAAGVPKCPLGLKLHFTDEEAEGKVTGLSQQVAELDFEPEIVTYSHSS